MINREPKTSEAENSQDTHQQLDVKQWLQIRKDAGLMIDPETAELTWWHAEEFDPYGVRDDLPDELRGIIGRQHFARAPGTDVWVWVYDLPQPAKDRVLERIFETPGFVLRLGHSLRGRFELISDGGGSRVGANHEHDD